MSIFKGAGVALVTPMHEDGSVNYEVLEELIDDQIRKGTDALIVCGTSGEAPTLDDDEHLEATRVAVAAAKGRVPIIAGTGSNNTAHAVMMSIEAKKHGADGLLLTGECADPWNPKTARATMGACFRLPAWEVGQDELPALLARSGLALYAAALRSDTRDVRRVPLENCAVVIGNEGNGVSPRLLEASDLTLKIPMRERCESLNAAAAAAVILWEMARGGEA